MTHEHDDALRGLLDPEGAPRGEPDLGAFRKTAARARRDARRARAGALAAAATLAVGSAAAWWATRPDAQPDVASARAVAPTSPDPSPPSPAPEPDGRAFERVFPDAQARPSIDDLRRGREVPLVVGRPEVFLIHDEDTVEVVDASPHVRAEVSSELLTLTASAPGNHAVTLTRTRRRLIATPDGYTLGAPKTETFELPLRAALSPEPSTRESP